jgi:hypothetical protein
MQLRADFDIETLVSEASPKLNIGAMASYLNATDKDTEE